MEVIMGLLSAWKSRTTRLLRAISAVAVVLGVSALSAVSAGALVVPPLPVPPLPVSVPPLPVDVPSLPVPISSSEPLPIPVLPSTSVPLPVAAPPLPVDVSLAPAAVSLPPSPVGTQAPQVPGAVPILEPAATASAGSRGTDPASPAGDAAAMVADPLNAAEQVSARASKDVTRGVLLAAGTGAECVTATAAGVGVPAACTPAAVAGAEATRTPGLLAVTGTGIAVLILLAALFVFFGGASLFSGRLALRRRARGVAATSGGPHGRHANHG
jgi:hypothetical protein